MEGGPPSGAPEKQVTLRDRVSSWAARMLPVRQGRLVLDRPAASVTFDDFPRSAWTVGGEIVERFGGRATYYASGRFCGIREHGVQYYDAEDLRAAHRAGHEVGSHTWAHRHVRELSSRELVDDARRNAEFLRRTLGDVRVSSFAYPYGGVSPRTKLVLSRLFSCCRGIRGGVNAGAVDLAHLYAVSLEVRHWSAAQVERRVDEARARNGWIVFFTHDVADAPTPFGSTPAILEHAMACVAAAGIPVLPVGQVAPLAGAPAAAEL